MKLHLLQAACYQYTNLNGLYGTSGLHWLSEATFIHTVEQIFACRLPYFLGLCGQNIAYFITGNSRYMFYINVASQFREFKF